MIVKIRIVAEVIKDEFEENCFIDRASFFFCVCMHIVFIKITRRITFVFLVFIWILFERDAE